MAGHKRASASAQRHERKARGARIARNVVAGVGVPVGAAISAGTIAAAGSGGMSVPLMMALNPEFAGIVAAGVAAPVLAGGAAVALHKDAKNEQRRARNVDALVALSRGENSIQRLQRMHPPKGSGLIDRSAAARKGWETRRRNGNG